MSDKIFFPTFVKENFYPIIILIYKKTNLIFNKNIFKEGTNEFFKSKK